jgi:hypothetical protein
MELESGLAAGQAPQALKLLVKQIKLPPHCQNPYQKHDPPR